MRIGSADPGEFALSQRTLSPEEDSLRKYLIAALVAVLSIAVTAVAVGQTPSTAPDVDMKFTPTNAGTKKKPKNSTLNLSVKNNQTDATVEPSPSTSARTSSSAARASSIAPPPR